MRTNPKFQLSTNLSDVSFVSLSNYYLQLNEFLKYFPDPNQYLVVDSSDLFTEPFQLLMRIFDFLDLDGSEYPKQTFIPKNETVSLNNIELFLFRTNLIKISKIFPRHLVHFLKDKIKSSAPNLKLTTFHEDEYNIVHNILAENMEILSNEFDINVKKWGFR